MTNFDLAGILIDLPRPEYVSLPETFISALAWSLNPDHKANDDREKIGRIFRPVSRESGPISTKSFTMSISAPTTSQAIAQFGQILKGHGASPQSLDDETLGAAALNSIAGIRPSKGIAQAVSPLSPHIALLQNTRGTAGKHSPADVAKYLETMYQFGRKDKIASETVSSKWLGASRLRLEHDPVLNILDSAVKQQLIPYPELPTFVSSSNLDTDIESLPHIPNSPFSWFAQVWDKLTSPEWVHALPARVWVDWATTVMRLAVGLGYLWESQWYVGVARSVVAGEAPDLSTMRAQPRTTVPWKSARAQVSIRNVTAPMKYTVTRGRAIRDYLRELQSDSSELDELSFDEVLIRLHSDETCRRHLTQLLGSRERKSTNEWELIRYALVTREESGPYTDYYGLLRPRGPRYTVVDPGTEWIAVIASLSTDGPGRRTTVSQLLKDLRSMGLQPEVTDLVSLLERAGLARGSADADQGVQIHSAY